MGVQGLASIIPSVPEWQTHRKARRNASRGTGLHTHAGLALRVWSDCAPKLTTLTGLEGTLEANKARRLTTPPRLVSSPPALVLPSRRLRRLTTAGRRPRLLLHHLRPERPQHIPGARPAFHQRRVVTEPVPHQPVEHPHTLGDVDGNRLEIGACLHMLAPPRPRSLQP